MTAAAVASLKARRDDVLSQIENLETNQRDLPNMKGDGDNVDYEAHKRGLYAELAELNRAIDDADPAGGGFYDGGHVIP